MYILFVSDYLIEDIKEKDIYNCYLLNESNTPNVGSETFKNFTNLIENADLKLCVKDNKVIAFAVCFTDSPKTTSYLNSINHMNFKQLKKMVKNFVYIDRIAVDDKYRNLGIGSDLYKKIFQYGKAQNLSAVTAEINYKPIENETSFEFHRKHNFKEIAIKKYSNKYEVSFQKSNIN